MDVPGWQPLVDLVARGDVVVLSGAGLSTESGNDSRISPTRRH